MVPYKGSIRRSSPQTNPVFLNEKFNLFVSDKLYRIRILCSRSLLQTSPKSISSTEKHTYYL